MVTQKGINYEGPNNLFVLLTQQFGQSGQVIENPVLVHMRMQQLYETALFSIVKRTTGFARLIHADDDHDDTKMIPY